MRSSRPRRLAAGIALALLLAPAAVEADAQPGGRSAAAPRDDDHGQPGSARGRQGERKRDRGPKSDAGKRGRKPAAAQPPAAAPAPTLGQPSQPAQGNPDPFRSLGAGSPFCRRAGLRGRASCRVSASVVHTYPVSNYGLDIQIETRIDQVENNLFAALQSVAAFVWLGLVYALKGVLLLLEWAFSLDLLGEAMTGVRRALDRLHNEVLGRPWFLAALAMAGLWGIWRGLVQRRTVQTAAGLAATVGLMVLGLVLVHNPAGTVGHASRLANDASLGFMSVASTGSTERPAHVVADAGRRLFDALAVRPWCALQFGDVRWCLRKRKEGFANADLWLAFPADGKERAGLYKLTKGEDPDGGGFFDDVKGTLGGALPFAAGGLGPAFGTLDLLNRDRGAELPAEVRQLVREEPARVELQEKEGTFTRLALLALIAAGLAGAVLLLLYLAVRLVLAGLLALMLLLLAPVMLLAPALGDTGREAFLAWGKRLIGALAAKLLFSLLLAITVVAATTLAALPVGWFGTWLLQLAFWWGVLLKRKELLGFVSAGHVDPGPGGFPTVARLYYNARAATAIAGAGKSAATSPLRRLGRQASAARLAKDETEQSAIGAAARDELDRGAERTRAAELAEARSTLALRPELEQTRRALSRELGHYDAQVVQAMGEGRKPRPPDGRERRLLAQRARVESRLADPAMRRAETTVRDSRPLGEADRAAWRERRLASIRSGLAPEHPESLRGAGIDPHDYRRGSPERREELVRVSREAIERDRRLLEAVPRPGRPAPATPETAAAVPVLPPEAVRERRREARTAWERERRVRRRRQRLYRR